LKRPKAIWPFTPRGLALAGSANTAASATRSANNVAASVAGATRRRPRSTRWVRIPTSDLPPRLSLPRAESCTSKCWSQPKIAIRLNSRGERGSFPNADPDQLRLRIAIAAAKTSTTASATHRHGRRRGAARSSSVRSMRSERRSAALVRFVLQGSVMASGRRLRIACQLADAKTDSQFEPRSGSQECRGVASGGVAPFVFANVCTPTWSAAQRRLAAGHSVPKQPRRARIP